MSLIGLQCKLYWGTAGNSAETPAKNVKDVSINLEKASADVTTRETDGWRVKQGTLRDASVEFQVRYDSADGFFDALQEAYLGEGGIALLVGDDAGKGLDADFDITNFSIDQALEEGVWVSVTAEPAWIGSSPRAPVWNETGVTAPAE